MSKRKKNTCQRPSPDRSKRFRPSTISDLFTNADEKAAQQFEELWERSSIFCPSMSMPYVTEVFSTLMDSKKNTPLGVLIKARYRAPQLLKILWGEVKENPVTLIFTLKPGQSIPKILVSFATQRKTVEAPPLLLRTPVHTCNNVRTVEEILLGKEYCFLKSLFQRELKELFPSGISEQILGFFLYH